MPHLVLCSIYYIKGFDLIFKSGACDFDTEYLTNLSHVAVTNVSPSSGFIDCRVVYESHSYGVPPLFVKMRREREAGGAGFIAKKCNRSKREFFVRVSCEWFHRGES